MQVWFLGIAFIHGAIISGVISTDDSEYGEHHVPEVGFEVAATTWETEALTTGPRRADVRQEYICVFLRFKQHIANLVVSRILFFRILCILFLNFLSLARLSSCLRRFIAALAPFGYYG